MAVCRREPAAGVLRLVLPLPFPGLESVNCYLIKDEDGDVLVDCGVFFPFGDRDHGWADIMEAFEVCDGARVNDIKALLVTHPHVDHYGMAGRFVKEANCELWMHSAAGRDIDLYINAGDVKRRMRTMLADHGVSEDELDELTAFEDPSAFISSVVHPTRGLADGDVLELGGRRWEVVDTPGHSRSHVCLFDSRERMLISGDHLLPGITPHIDFVRGADSDPLGEFLGSLRRVEKLGPELVLPGHGRPFRDGSGRARAIARHHERRLAQIAQVITREPRSASYIVDEIFGRELLNFQRRLAFGEALAHLAYLRRRGEVERVRSDGGGFLYVKKGRKEAR